MSAKTIKFEIVTPERVVLRKEISQVSVPTLQGEITVLPDHIPLVAVLQPGVIEAHLSDGLVEIMSVSGGFIEVMKDKVVILADTAERAEEIDEKRVGEAYLRAEEAKKKAELFDEAKFAELTVKIEKELARTRALRRWRKISGGDTKS